MRNLLIMLTLLLSGCTLTVDHNHKVDVMSNVVSKNHTVTDSYLNQTNFTNDVEYTTCKSEALNQLLALEKINVKHYKERRDVKGLVNAAFQRLKVQEMLLAIVNSELNKCVAKKE